MAYLLGDQTLLNPKSFKREFVETSASNLLIDAKTTKRVENRKERFTLTYQNLTAAETSSILSEYELDETRVFEVTEDNLTIAATDVHIDISTRNYPLTGKAYRHELNLILTEVI
jgi:hypothetical protein